MKQVTTQEFIDYLEEKGGPLLKNQLESYNIEMVLGDYEDMCYIHEGDLMLDTNWQPETANLIIAGSILSSDLVNCQSSHEEVDEGGSLWVLGDMKCQHFANHYGKAVFVDGNMIVSGLAVNAFENSLLIVTQDFECHYFYGIDIWVEAGGKIRIEYGNGYGLPIGYTDASAQSVDPRHSREESLDLLKISDDSDPDSLVDRIKNREVSFEKQTYGVSD